MIVSPESEWDENIDYVKAKQEVERHIEQLNDVIYQQKTSLINNYLNLRLDCFPWWRSNMGHGLVVIPSSKQRLRAEWATQTKKNVIIAESSPDQPNQ